jgi:hypothetical protein
MLSIPLMLKLMAYFNFRIAILKNTKLKKQKTMH